MEVSNLFADRIGGPQFGKTNRVFKFTLIDSAKREFIKKNPAVRVIDMGVGEPEERAGDQIASALHRNALIAANRIYPNNGGPRFKEAAARYLNDLLKVSFDPEQEIVHCIGTKTALAQIPFAFVNPGESIICTAPGYPVLPTIAQWLGGRVHALPLRCENGYLPDLGDLDQLIKKEKPKILLLNYPNNPTGGVATREFYETVIGLAHRYQFLIVQDAAYADFVYDQPFISPLQIDGGRDVTLELYSLSKSFNMQGYRIGFAVSSPRLLNAFALVKDNIDNGQFLAIQEAGIEAFDNARTLRDGNREKYRRRLQAVTEILNAAGIEVKCSPGTFYLYFPVPSEFHGIKFESAQAFSNYLIGDLGIVTVPWEEAGPHVRLSMTFEIGTQSFTDERSVLDEFRQRMMTKRVS